jgi:hypothetical protein
VEAISKYRLERVCKVLGVANLDSFSLAEVTKLCKKTDKQLQKLARKSEARLTPDKLAKLTPDEQAKLKADLDDADAWLAELEKPTPTATPAPTPAAQPAATQQPQEPAYPLGLGGDGYYRCTDAQLRDPTWCISTQMERAKAGENIRIVNE